MSKRKYGFTFTIATVLIFLIAACTSSGTTSTGATNKSSNGTVTVAVASFDTENAYPPDADPGDYVYMLPMFDFLIGASPDGSLSTQTGALESWSPNSNATVWTLTLRPGMKWQDGTAVTSADLAYTLKAYASPKATCGTTCGALQSELAGVDIVNGLTVRMKLKVPDVNIPAEFGPIEGGVLIIPEHYLEKVGISGFKSHPMGSGPWKFVSRTIGQSIDYVANRNYWNRAEEPKFTNLHILLVPDQNTRNAMLQTGEADLIALEPNAVSQVKGFKIFSIKNTDFSEVHFLDSYSPANMSYKLAFREALTLAINVPQLISAFYPDGTGRPTSGDAIPFTPQTLGNDPSLKPYPYDPTEAKRLLAEAGYHGQTVTLWTVVFPDGPEQGEINQAIAGFWSSVGVKVQIVQSDFTTLAAHLASGNFAPYSSIDLTAWPTSNRPSVLSNIESLMLTPAAGGSLRTYWDPTQMDTEYSELSGIVNEQERNARLQQLDAQLYNQYWAIPLALSDTLYAAGPKIAGWEPITSDSKVLPYWSLQPKP